MSNVESVSLQRKNPEICRCSRLFFAEHDLIDRKDGKLVASIYSTPQSLEPNFGYREQLGIQTFGVLWGQNGFDSRIINIIEEGIVESALSPIQLFHHDHGTLTIILNPRFRRCPSDFIDAWQGIAFNSVFDHLELRCLYEKDNRLYKDGRQFCDLVKTVISSEMLGIENYNSAHSLFDEDWDEYNQEDPREKYDNLSRLDEQSQMTIFDIDSLDDDPQI
ncbi:hypothetical protein PMI38_00829 [Pseudomonas sp. GM84]|uniref:hypothetical protein n=1 Tax=Pseudomonas sp. GM84 TaxID=1144340 RepID=UPI00026FCF5B|nr:hypothetical protein [Pseudomonas sp. GM84]EJN39597.1 hypothetical protein PMI38_00829 [Pseudomonas sp. GM84]